jgi:hypothetical protein
MVDLVRSGRTPEALSREFEPTAQAIWNWVRQADRDEGRRHDGPTNAEREELAVCGVGTGNGARSAISWQRQRPGSHGRPQ